jgi:hypothetical protein
MEAHLYAVIYALTREEERECLALCLRLGWKVVAMVRDDIRGQRWRDALAALTGADVLVVYSRGRLPPDRRPRLAAVDEERQRAEGRRRGEVRRRPRIID